MMNNEKSFNEKEYYTISETARKIGQSEHTVKRLCKEGRLKRNDSINPNQPVINRDSLFVFLKEENKRFY